MKKVVYIFLFIPFTLFSQRNVSGRITNAENGEPVAGVSVFISNTTIGANTNAEGYYQLTIPEEGAYRLTISFMGFKSVFKDIEPGNTSLKFDAALYTNINELKEVTVTAKVKPRQEDINLFWETVLGKKPSRKTISVTNPEAVFYYYNLETNILKVTCYEPLQIVNYETGYQIQYVLDNFTHDYNKDFTGWSNQFIFTELAAENLKQKNNWEKKREEVYRMSLTKFIKSLYNNSLYNDGFVLATFRRNLNSSNPFKITLINPDSILSIKNTDNSKTLNLSNRQVMLICYGRPVNADDLNKIPLSLQSGDFLKNSGLFMNLLSGDSIHIYPNGTYTNELIMAPVNSSKTLLTLDMRLPLGYHPEELTSPSLKNENIFDFDSIDNHFNTQISVFPQEKVYLQTDKPYYITGEKIFFRAFLLDASSNLQDTLSRYVYVELINPVDSVAQRIKIRKDSMNMFYGAIPLPEDLPQGTYTIRAYTQYMLNQGENSFFSKQVRIGDPKILEEKTKTDLPLANHPEKDFDVSFYPEGGHLITGQSSNVAFKALNTAGIALDIKGEVIDSKGDTITQFKTFYYGMGDFFIKPLPNEYYQAICHFGNRTLRFNLPEVQKDAFALKTIFQNKKLLVTINKPDLILYPELYLLIHSRGSVIYAKDWNPEKDFIAFDTSIFPSGVSHILLLTKDLQIVSERLIFLLGDDNGVATFQAQKDIYKKRERVQAEIQLKDEAQQPLKGNFSIAVTNDKEVVIDTTTGILSDILLRSELKGSIENPEYYFQQGNKDAEKAADLLMKTQGWTRYAIPDVVQGKFTYPKIPFEKSQEISGIVKNGLLSKPAKNYKVSLVSLSDDGKLIHYRDKASIVVK